MFERMYLKKNGGIRLLFDVSFLIYLIAYFVFYGDGAGFSTIRLVATVMFGLAVILQFLVHIRTIDILFIWYLLFIIFGGLSIVWARYDSAVTGTVPSMIRILIVFVGLKGRLQDEKDIDVILGIYLIAVVFRIMYIANLMISFYSIQYFYIYRFGDNFQYNSNETAMMACICLLILIYWSQKYKFKKWYIFVVFFFMATIVITQSKKGMIGIVLGVIIFTILKENGAKGKLKKILLAIIAIITIIEMLTNVPELYDLIGYRFDQFNDAIFGTLTIGTSTGNRIMLIKQALDIWMNHIFIGVGLNNFSSYQSIGDIGYYAHNNYAELLADVGLIGFCIYYYLPVKLCFAKVQSKDTMGVFFKTLMFVLLVFDIGAVSYNAVAFIIFYAIYFYKMHINTSHMKKYKKIYKDGVQ